MYRIIGKVYVSLLHEVIRELYTPRIIGFCPPSK